MNGKTDLLTQLTRLVNLKTFHYIIEIGVISGISEKRKPEKTTKVKVGITNAELMFIHENGSPLRKLPARPVLHMTIEYANKYLLKKAIDKAYKAYLATGKEEAIQEELNRLAVRMENYAREIIYSKDGRLAPNAPSTIARKGENYPLHITGQLARSITCRVRKI